MRLRDLAGLVVIDFIDMEEAKNDRAVEKKMKDCLRFDRARVQMGKISGFGLLELSRQRRRTGILEGSSHVCSHCQGTGRVRSVESSALRLMRAIDEESYRRSGREIEVRSSTDVALYVLNEKRVALAEIEESRSVAIRVVAVNDLNGADFEIVALGERVMDGDLDEEAPARGRPERARANRAPALAEAPESDIDIDESDDAELEEPGEGPARDSADGEGEGNRRSRRRGRRGGKRQHGDEGGVGQRPAARTHGRSEDQDKPDRGERGGRKRWRRRGQGRRLFEVDGGEHLDLIATDPITPPAPAEPEREPELEPAPKPDLIATQDFMPEPEPEPEPEPDVSPAPAFAASAFDAPPVEDAAPGPSAEDTYEPDLARRERFFARLNRWGKR
jgi:ribonuclease E